MWSSLNKNKRGELILLRDEENKNKNVLSNKKIKYYYNALPGGSVRAKNENSEALITFTEASSKDSERLKITSSKKKPIAYRIDSYNYSNDSRDKKIEVKSKAKRLSKPCQLPNNKYDYAEESSDSKHKRSKSQTINSVKGRKGNSVKDGQPEEVSHLLQQHLQKNSMTSYNLVNEYLENPGKVNNISAPGSNS